jgi:capsid protein
MSHRRAKARQSPVRRVRPSSGGVTASLRARYDAAQTTDDNRRHWANADGLSADSAGSPEVRRILRNRTRYEVANNCNARGIVLTLANDLIGRGPRLQMLIDGQDELNRLLEARFTAWADAVGLACKLRTMRMARAQDGEAFAVLHSNPRLGSPVQLDLALVEADRVCNPMLAMLPLDPLHLDGIQFDESGNALTYSILRRHPGDTYNLDPLWVADTVSAGAVLHWFRADRPGQRRGLPDLMPALPLFALLRRFTLATVTAAESAAELAVIMRTNANAAVEPGEVDPWIRMEIERNTAVFAPEGWEPSQMKPEHPSTTYPAFRREIVAEIARCLSLPMAVALGDSSGYNYASGRLDWQTYIKTIDVEREVLERIALERILNAWLREALFAYPDLMAEMARSEWPHQWFWDGREHVDPNKEASALHQNLADNATTLSRHYARQGLDWETELRQRAREMLLQRELGLTNEQAAGLAPGSPQATPAIAALEQRVAELEDALAQNAA